MQRADVGVLSIGWIDVVVPVPLHLLASESRTVAPFAIRRPIEVCVDDRIDGNLQPQRWTAAVSRHERESRDEVTAGALPVGGDAITVDAELVCVCCDVGERGVRVFCRCRETGLGRKAILDGKDSAAGRDSELAALSLHPQEIADHPATTVEREHRRGVRVVVCRIDA